MANEWGPLEKLAGEWEGEKGGLDTAFSHSKGEVLGTPYREKCTMKPFGPVDNGAQSLYGLDYRTAAWKEGEENPFHTEVGYWMWDGNNNQVMRCFLIPRASALIAGATVEPNATSFKLASVLGSNTYGILSNKYLDEIAKTTRFDVTVTIHANTFSYDETTVVEHQKHPTIIMHTDRNTLTRVSQEA